MMFADVKSGLFGAYLDCGPQIELLYIIQRGLLIHGCSYLLSNMEYVKYSTTDGVNAVDHFSRMTEFYNS